MNRLLGVMVVVVGGFVLASPAWAAEEANSGLPRVRQALKEAPGGAVVATDKLTVSFAPRPAGAVIRVYLARPAGLGLRWYAHGSNLIGTFEVPADQAAKGVAEVSVSKLHDPKVPPLYPHSAQTMWAIDELNKMLPSLVVFEVDDNAAAPAYVTVHLLPDGAIVPQSREFPTFHGAAFDKDGNIVLADRANWRGRRYSPNWELLTTFPKASSGHSSDPAECFDVALDSRGNVYVLNRGGVYKYDGDGNPADWESKDEHLKCPYPIDQRNLLGVRLDPNVEGPKEYVFGPGGGGAGRKTYVAAEMIKQPGFAYEWGGMDIGPEDKVYLGRTAPTCEIQVFAPSGKYERTISLPENVRPSLLRVLKDGTLWTTNVNGHLVRIDGEGKVLTETTAPCRLLHVGGDGLLYAAAGAEVRRLTTAGEPRPFTAQSPRIREEGRCLSIGRPAETPPDAPGYGSEINGLVATAGNGVTTRGYIYVQTREGRLLRFGEDGVFRPESPSVRAQLHETGNIFIGDEPARVGLTMINLDTKQGMAVVDARVYDWQGKPLTRHGIVSLIEPLSIISEPLALDNEEQSLSTVMGYYQIDVTAQSGHAFNPEVLGTSRLFGGRVAERSGGFRPYSAFGSVRMEFNAELMRRIGGGLNRGHSLVYWDDIEPTDGKLTQFPRGQADYLRERSLPLMMILGYGEPWFQGGYPACRVYSYDRFWQYCADVIEQHKDEMAMWQFWNEPNYFWHVPGRDRYEHYVMVLQGVYSIAKALDPDTPLICDGFAGEASAMEKFAQWGAAGFTDGVPVHYPGVKPVKFDDMPLTGAVESKAPMIRELCDIRDRLFPGRETLNTEEGLWGLADREPRHGAELLTRMYVSQIAAGLDRMTWFEVYDKNDPTYLLRGIQEGPWPAYFAYATASQFLEDAIYIGSLPGVTPDPDRAKPLPEGLTQAHVFAVRTKPVIVAWSMKDERTLTLAAPKGLRVTDWQGNAVDIQPDGDDNKIAVTLTSYPVFIEGDDLRAVLRTMLLRVDEAAIRGASRDGLDMNAFLRKRAAVQAATNVLWSTRPAETDTTRLLDLSAIFHAERWCEARTMIWFGSPQGVPKDSQVVAEASRAVDDAAAALTEAQSDGRYLRESNVVLSIARRAQYFMNLRKAGDEEDQKAAEQLAVIVNALANQVRLYIRDEKPWYPGVMIRVEADTAAIRRNTPADKPLDEQFAAQVTHQAGETVELEITVYNWTREPLTGTVVPVLPDGWSVTSDSAKSVDVNAAPRRFTRGSIVVAIPNDAKPGVYTLGACLPYKNTDCRELHAQRVEVK